MPLFTLDLSQPHGHRIGITLRFVPQTPTQDVLLPAWTPGSYLEREYVRHLDRLEVLQGGSPVTPRRLERHRWRLAVTPGREVEVRYGVLGVERSVRTNWLDGDGAFLTAAAWALLVEGQRWQPQRLQLLLPEGWQAACSLPREGPGFEARDFDALVDAPIACGELRQLTFDVAGHPHHWVWQGLPHPAPEGRWRQALPALAEAACRLMGETAPAAAAYHLLVRFCGEGYGGLEHDDGCALLYSRRELNHADGQRRLYQLVAHEYLHQWNVRRLRPRELQPYDYGGATIVPTLWFAEGVTSYFDGLVVLRAGLCSEDELLRDWSDDISRYLTTPGRAVQTLEASSEEAWVKLYRPDAHSAGHQISYYLKGQLVALLLDLHLLAAGDGLQGVLQRLWRQYGRCGRGYGQEDLFAVIGAAAPDLPGSLDRWLRSLDELPLDGYLKSVGLELLAEPATAPATGLRLETASGLLQVQRVDRGGAGAPPPGPPPPPPTPAGWGGRGGGGGGGGGAGGRRGPRPRRRADRRRRRAAAHPGPAGRLPPAGPARRTADQPRRPRPHPPPHRRRPDPGALATRPRPLRRPRPMSAPSPVAPRQGALSHHPRSPRALLLALALGTAVSVGLAAVVVSGLRREPDSGDLLLRRPGLGWIRDAARTPSEQRDRTPAPPSQARWVSPLTRACPVADPTLRQHLSQMRLQITKVRPDPTNYASRRTRDAFGQAIDPTPSVIVLHETVYGLQSAVNSVTTPHANDDDQASYHTLVGLDGRIVQTVDPAQRAYGAGFSAFDGRWVFTNRRFSGSLNNFALHVSLETPEDGENAGPNHSGYTPAQYDALARVIADWMVRYGIRPEAITTHRHVDLGGERADPRSFDWTELQRRLTALGLVC